MAKNLLVLVVALILIPGSVFAQKAGSFIAGLDIGMASATGDFADNADFMAGSGFSVGAELRYTLVNNFSVGPFFRYYRFGSDLISEFGQISFNISQYGALARLTMFNIEKGKLFFFGGGGLFKPNKHSWAPDYTYDEQFERGNFFTGGLGICSDPYAVAIYELEFRYCTGDADFLSSTSGSFTTYTFDYFHVGLKLMFNSKGISAPPRY